MALVALAAQVGGLVLQQILERFDPGQQTEVLKAALNLLEGCLHSVTLLGHRTKRYHPHHPSVSGESLLTSGSGVWFKASAHF
jgi:hypothetical protein